MSKVCKFCLKVSRHFKNGSHVFPRWLMKLAKEDTGCFSSIENGRILTKQSDIRTESWCEDCENRFAKLDAIGAKFFRDRGYLVEELVAEHLGLPTLFELHSGERFVEVKLFIGSLVARYYLHHVEQDLPLKSRDLFEKIFLLYRKGEPVSIRIANMVALKGSVMIGTESRDVISFLINGYWIQVFHKSNSYAPVPKNTEEKLIPIAKVTSPKHPFYKMANRIFTTARKNSVPPKSTRAGNPTP